MLINLILWSQMNNASKLRLLALTSGVISENGCSFSRNPAGKANLPILLLSCMAGINRLQMDAATMTPAATPVSIFSTASHSIVLSSGTRRQSQPAFR